MMNYGIAEGQLKWHEGLQHNFKRMEKEQFAEFKNCRKLSGNVIQYDLDY